MTSNELLSSVPESPEPRQELQLPSAFGFARIEAENAMNNLRTFIKLARAAFNRECARREAARPHSDAKHRCSNISYRMVLCLCVLLSGAAKVMRDTRDVEQPQERGNTFTFVSVREESMPSLHDDIETVFSQLQSDDMNDEFLRDKIKSYTPSAIGCVYNYHAHPTTLQEHPVACCNGLANWNGERKAREGYKTYTVCMWPKNPLRRAWDSWHEVQVLCVQQGQRYIIYDNADHKWMSGTLAECLEKLHPNMEIIPIAGGIVPWRRTTETVLGGMRLHWHWNVEEADMRQYPMLEPPWDLTVVDARPARPGPAWNAREIVIANLAAANGEKTTFKR